MKKITYILLSACFLLTSCEDFLNRDPDAKVGSGDYFTDEGSLLTYINGFIQKYTPSAADLGYGDGYSDIMATEKSFTFLTNASWTPDLQSGWSISNWTPIYNINYFLVHMREAKGLSEATYNHYEGTAVSGAHGSISRRSRPSVPYPGTTNRSTPKTWWRSTNRATAVNTSWSACSKT